MAILQGLAVCVFLVGILATSAIPPKLGGWKQVDVNDETVQNLAKFAAEDLDHRSNTMYKSRLVELTHASVQVVAGFMYKLQFDFGETDCKKNDDSKDVEDCELHKVQECTVKVYVKAWENYQNVESFTCSKKPEEEKIHPEQAVMVGGETDADPNRKDVNNAADFAVDEMNANSNNINRAMKIKVKEATTQVVAGIKFKMTLQMALSDCPNTEEHRGATLDQCPIANGAEEENCQIEVLHQSWVNPEYQLLDSKCKIFNADNTLHFTPAKNLLGGDGHDIGNYGSFEEFKKKYNKQYETKEEEANRFEIFRDNMRTVKKLQETDKATGEYGATQFADMTLDEFRKHLGTPIWDTSYDPSLKQAEIPSVEIPDAYDWRDHGAVTAVKNQGMCGSCWAFSTTGNIEGQWAVKKQKLVSLSEQELVDCDKLDQGCNGGLPSNAYKEIIRLGGLETETEYPYDGKNEKCEFVKSDVKVYINSSVNISSNEDDMARWLLKNGPISIGINAMAMQFYFGGVSHPWKIFCNPEMLDHGVLIVGFGTKKGLFDRDIPYWIIKNSWGEKWGEKGYYLVYRGAGVCGLNSMPTSAIVD